MDLARHASDTQTLTPPPACLTCAPQIAASLRAEKLILMTDVPGVLRNKDDPSTKVCCRCTTGSNWLSCGELRRSQNMQGGPSGPFLLGSFFGYLHRSLLMHARLPFCPCHPFPFVAVHRADHP